MIAVAQDWRKSARRSDLDGSVFRGRPGSWLVVVAAWKPTCFRYLRDGRFVHPAVLKSIMRTMDSGDCRYSLLSSVNQRDALKADMTSRLSTAFASFRTILIGRKR
jgi:hypothetical protein